jgi:hypothetical protein
MLQLLTYMILLEKVHVFVNYAEYTYLELTEILSTLKHLNCWKYSFQKLTQFSQGNNVVVAAALNMDGFLWRERRVSSSQLNRPVGSQESLSPPWNTKVSGRIPFKSKLKSHRENMCQMLLL